MTQLLERSECQKLLIQSTTKIYSGTEVFIGTGFFVLPNILVSCYHVFANNSIKKFKIEGHDSPILLTPENTFFVEGLDLICIDVSFELGEQCVPLALSNVNIDDNIWGYSFNIDYEGGTPITSKLIEEAEHKDNLVFRIQDDVINQCSSGTPLWNTTKNSFLGVVYWLKERKRQALVIPALSFKEHFPVFHEKNIEYHKKNPAWKTAIEKDQQHSSIYPKPVKRRAHSEQFEIYNHQYVGRTTPRTALKAFLTDDSHFIFIYGIGGVGKSHLVKSVIEELEIPFVYVRLNPSSNIKGLAYQLGLSNIEEESTSWINQDLINSIQQIKECVIIDDFYEIEDDVNLQNTLLQLASVSQGKIVLISRALPELYLAASYTLPKIHIKFLGREEHRQFVTEFIRFKSIGGRDFISYEEKLWEVSKGHPLISQIIINYSDDDIYDDFDIDALQAWDFEEDREGKIFVSKLLDTVLKKGKETEKEFLLSFSLILGQVPAPLLRQLPGYNRDNLKSLIKRKHFIQTLTKEDKEKTYNLHPLVRELLRKKAGDRPGVQHSAAQFFQEKAKATQYEDMVAFNNALYHYQNASSEAYEEFIKSTNAVFLNEQIKVLINSNISGSIARLKERQRRKPHDLATYNELSRLYMFREQEEQCFAILDEGLELDSANEILLFSKAYACKIFQKEQEAENIFEQLANLDNTYAIFQLCLIEFSAQNFLSCVRLCDWILWLEPKNFQALYYLGRVLYEQKHYNEASVFFDKILEQDPENPQALQYKGRVLYEQKHYNEALVFFDKILGQDPENFQAPQYKGMILCHQKHYNEALVFFDKILEQDPENPQALLYKGMVLYHQKHYNEALVFFDKILEQDSENPQALLYKGMVLYHQKHYNEALVFFDKILEQDPENFQASQYTGMVLYHQKHYNEALVFFDKILEQDPENFQASQYTGMVLYHQKHYNEASVFFDKILEQDPESPQALLYKGMVLCHQKHYNEALVFFDKILEQDPENPQALLYKGMVLYHQKHYNEALVFFDKKLEQYPENPQALQYKGMVLYHQKHYNEASVFFDKILEQDPENPQALLYKGKTLIRLKNSSLAEKVLYKADQLDRHNVFIKTEFANSLRLNGKAKNAIRVYESAIQLHKRNVQTYNGLFRTYKENLRDYQKASEVIDRLLDVGVYDVRLLKNGIYLLIHHSYRIYDYDKARMYLDAMRKARTQNNWTKAIITDLDYKIKLYSKGNN